MLSSIYYYVVPEASTIILHFCTTVYSCVFILLRVLAYFYLAGCLMSWLSNEGTRWWWWSYYRLSVFLPDFSCSMLGQVPTWTFRQNWGWFLQTGWPSYGPANTNKAQKWTQSADKPLPYDHCGCLFMINSTFVFWITLYSIYRQAADELTINNFSIQCEILTCKPYLMPSNAKL